MPKLTKRADGLYQVYATIGYDENNKRIRKAFYGQTQREALAKKKAYMDGLVLERDASKMTLKKWAETWLESYSTGGVRNQENNRSIINVFLKEIGNMANKPISDILPADIQGYAKSQSCHTKSHVNKAKRTIESLFNTAKDNGFIINSPCQGIVWDSKKTGTRDSVEANIADLITENWHLHSAGIWAMLVLYAGLRPSEAFALYRDQIDETTIHVRNGSHFEHGQLVITEGKPKSDAGVRDIPILPPLLPVIKALPKEGLVCRSTKGFPVSQSAYKRNWTAFIHLLEQVHNGKEPNPARWQYEKESSLWNPLPKTDMYSLRHSFCSMLYDAGVDVKTAQYLMGHSDLEVTLKIYTHLSEKKKQHSFDALFEYCKTNGSNSGSNKTPETL